MNYHNSRKLPDIPVGPILEPLKGSPVFDLLKRELNDFSRINKIPRDEFFNLLSEMEKELSLFASEQAKAQLYQIDADKSYVEMIKFPVGSDIRKSWEDHWHDRNKQWDLTDRSAQSHLVAFHGLVRRLRDFT